MLKFLWNCSFCSHRTHREACASLTHEPACLMTRTFKERLRLSSPEPTRYADVLKYVHYKSNCKSLQVKLKLFRSYCICMKLHYGLVLQLQCIRSCHRVTPSVWSHFSVIANIVVSLRCFLNCVYLHNSKFSFECSLLRCSNMLVSSMSSCQLTVWQVDSH